MILRTFWPSKYLDKGKKPSDRLDDDVEDTVMTHNEDVVDIVERNIAWFG